jgi:flagellar basal-body rod protein FlgF
VDRLAYTALSATISSSKQRVQLTNNLANMNTVGFKMTGSIEHSTAKVEGLGFDTRYQPMIVGSEAEEQVDLRPGAYINTGNDLDIAMMGETVLGVQSKYDQSLGFTRRGDLHITSAGLIETGDGDLVMGESGPVSVPLGQIITFGSDGSIFARSTAGVDGLQTKVGELMLRDTSQTPLQRRIDGLFEPSGTQVRGVDFASGPKKTSIQAGTLEGSNVNPVVSLINMMDYSRSFEMQIKIISEINNLDEKGSALIA